MYEGTQNNYFLAHCANAATVVMVVTNCVTSALQSESACYAAV